MWLRIRISVLAALLLLMAGCGGQKSLPLSPNSSVGTSTATSQPAGTPAASPQPNPAEGFVAVIQGKWGLFGNPQASASLRTEWVGVDDNGKVVVEGNLRQDTPKWLSDRDVSRVLVREGQGGAAPGQRQTFSIVTRGRFDGWPLGNGQALPFPTSDWPKYSDWYGALSPSSEDFTWANRNEQVQTWLKQRLGDRLVQAQLGHEPHITVNVVAKPGNPSDLARVTEAAVLQAGLNIEAGVQTLEIEYQGTPKVKTVVINDLSEWAKHGSDLRLLQSCIEVDGVQGMDCPLGQTPDPDSLAHLLGRRAALRAIVPQGAQLILADAGDPRVVIEADIPDGQTWEQAWTVYSGVIDRVFATTPETFEVELLLHRGNEVEYFLVNLNRWAVRQFLTEKMGIAVEGTSLPWTANVYRRYQSSAL